MKNITWYTHAHQMLTVTSVIGHFPQNAKPQHLWEISWFSLAFEEGSGHEWRKPCVEVLSGPFTPLPLFLGYDFRSESSSVFSKHSKSSNTSTNGLYKFTPLPATWSIWGTGPGIRFRMLFNLILIVFGFFFFFLLTTNPWDAEAGSWGWMVGSRHWRLGCPLWRGQLRA